MRKLVAALMLVAAPVLAGESRATGDLGLVVERATGSVLLVDRSERRAIARIGGLGDLSHASAVFSPDERYAYVFGRDGGLTKLDLVERRVAARIVQAGNAIGGAISDDGTLVAVANYEPGGVRVFDAGSLAPVADIPTGSKVVGLEDAQDRRFVFSLLDGNAIWIADFAAGPDPALTKLADVGLMPYDALVTEDGRTYLAGLFGEDGLVAVDLWADPPAPRRVLDGYGRGEAPLPVYKMPHLEGWALAGDRFALPAVGRHEIIWADARSFAELGRTPTHGQPVFAVARPGGRQVWVSYALPRNDTVEVIDTRTGRIVHTLTPGPAVLHMEFAPRGDEVWISVRDANRIDIYDARSFAKLGEIAAESPSGIFFAARAHRIGL
jgi:protein NirF